MITTPELINSLAANLTPVQRLRPPVARAFTWLMLALFVLALLSVSHGLRPDFEQRLTDTEFVVNATAALMTGVLAAIAAFMVSLPDRSRLWLLLPVPATILWLTSVGYQCLTHWVAFEANSISLGDTARCFATLVLTSLPLSLAMLIMLRYAALLRPTAVTLMGSLAVAAITATALSLFHAFDATVMILIWNFGTAGLIVGIGAIAGWRMSMSAALRAPQA